MNNIALEIKYYAFFSNYDLEDFDKIEDFKAQVSKSYISNIKGIPCGRGAGAYELIINAIVNLTLQDYLGFILGGIAYDLVKKGSQKYLLKPLFSAFETLNKANNNSIAIREFRIKFEESELIIKALDNDGVYSVLPKVFEYLIDNYQNFKHPESRHFPQQISIPVIFDPNLKETYHPKYREPLGEEEYLEGLTKGQYFKYWGLNFELSQKPLVYDIDSKIITDEEFSDAYIFERFIINEL